METFLERYFTKHFRMSRGISYFMCIKENKFIIHPRPLERLWKEEWIRIADDLHNYFGLELWVYRSYSHFRAIEIGKKQPKHRKLKPW